MASLQQLLISLGIDVSELAAGGAAARGTINSIGNAAQQAAAQAQPLITTLDKTAASSRTVSSASKLAADAMKAQSAAAGPLVAGMSGAEGAIAATTAATGGLVTGMQTAQGAIMATTASTGPFVTSQQAAAAALRATYAAAGPLVGAVRNAQGAWTASNAPLRQAASNIREVDMEIRRLSTDLTGQVARWRMWNGEMMQLHGPGQNLRQDLHNIGMEAEAVARRASFMQRTLSMAFAFSGGVAVTNIINFVGNALVGFNSRLEQAHIAFETLLGDAGKGDQFIEDMMRFAQVTPFDFKGIEEASQRLLAMGFTAEQVLPVMNAVGNATAALGGNTEKIDRITLALGQMATAGRVNSQDMRQLTEAGIPAWKILADAIGKSVAETRKLAEQGLIPANQALDALITGMEERFANMMERQARTAMGAFSTIRDAAYETISAAVKPVFDAVSAGMVGLADFLITGGGKYVAPVIYGIAAALGVALIPKLWGTAEAAAAASIALGGLTIPILPLIIAVTTLGIAWQENFGGIRDTLGPVLSGLGSALGSIGKVLADFGANAQVLMNIIVLLAAAITTKFVASLILAGVNMALDAVVAVVFGNSLGVIAGKATVAAASTGIFSRSLIGLTAALGGATGVIGLFAVAITLLILNFDRVAQGVRVFAYYMLSSFQIIAEVAAKVFPPIGFLLGAVADDVENAKNQLVGAMADAEKAIKEKELQASLGVDVERFDLDELVGKFKATQEQFIDQTRSLVEQFGTNMDDVVAAAGEAGGEAMSEMAAEIRAHQQAPLDALIELHDMVRNQLTPTAEIARLVGMMTMEDMAAGLRSSDPAVRAQMEATRELIIERLDELTDGAYSAGVRFNQNLANGLSQTAQVEQIAKIVASIPAAMVQDALTGSNVTELLMRQLATMRQVREETQRQSNVWDKQYKPSADAVADAQKSLNAELQKTQAYSQGLSALNSAFGEIRQAANRYFDELHQHNLRAIDDARDHKNAILDAKMVLNQAPVTAAQRALDFQRRQLEEFRLREAVREADDPKSRRDAILALEDFLMQTRIDEMQQQVDAANEQLEARQKHNDDVAAAQKAAEDQRYAQQKDDFERQLELLRRYLEKHPGEWSSANTKVLALLNSFGINYKDAGRLLGANFVDGLRENIAAAQQAAFEMADIIPGYSLPTPPGDTTGGGAVGAAAAAAAAQAAAAAAASTTNTTLVGGGTKGALPLDTGMWRVMKDGLLATLHQDEMVVPADVARLIRMRGAEGLTQATSAVAPSHTEAAMASREGGYGGPKSIVFQVGDEHFGEITDRQLANQQSIYRQRRRPSTGSVR